MQSERGPVAIEPFLGLAWVRLDADGFTEAGGEAALSGEGETSTVGYSTFGFRAGRSFETGLETAGGSGAARAMTFTPHLSLAWRHAWGDLSTSASLSFAEMTAQGFVVSGVTLARIPASSTSASISRSIRRRRWAFPISASSRTAPIRTPCAPRSPAPSEVHLSASGLISRATSRLDRTEAARGKPSKGGPQPCGPGSRRKRLGR